MSVLTSESYDPHLMEERAEVLAAVSDYVAGSDLPRINAISIDDQGTARPEQAVSFQNRHAYYHIVDASFIPHDGALAERAEDERANHSRPGYKLTALFCEKIISRDFHFGKGSRLEAVPAITFSYRVDESSLACDGISRSLIRPGRQMQSSRSSQDIPPVIGTLAKRYPIARQIDKALSTATRDTFDSKAEEYGVPIIGSGGITAPMRNLDHFKNLHNLVSTHFGDGTLRFLPDDAEREGISMYQQLLQILGRESLRGVELAEHEVEKISSWLVDVAPTAAAQNIAHLLMQNGMWERTRDGRLYVHNMGDLRLLADRSLENTEKVLATILHGILQINSGDMQTRTNSVITPRPRKPRGGRKR